MKIIQVPFCFYPDPVGGTEVYVESLARHLRLEGTESVVVVSGERDEDSMHESIRVRRFRTEPVNDLNALYGAGDVRAVPGFMRILEEERPDVVHLHGATSIWSLHLVQAVRRRGVPVVFTYHLPTATCQRGTLLRWGSEVCDGLLDVGRCTRCTLQSLGLPRPAAEVVGRVPVAVGEGLARAGRSGGTWTALRMRQLLSRSHTTIRAFLGAVDHIVVLCSWAQDVLTRNGVPPEKISLSRHGLPSALTGPDLRSDQVALRDLPLRVAYFGRPGYEKGADILVRALRLMPEALVVLDLYIVTQDAAGEAYLQTLRQIAADDARIRFLSPVPQRQVAGLLRGYHLLAVPSRWLETGPLVVLEAFAAGTPVLGLGRGGTAELVESGVNGLLIASDAPTAWRDALDMLNGDRDLLGRLRAGVRPPRTMQAVARDMQDVYRAVQSPRIAVGGPA